MLEAPRRLPEAFPRICNARSKRLAPPLTCGQTISHRHRGTDARCCTARRREGAGDRTGSGYQTRCCERSGRYSAGEPELAGPARRGLEDWASRNRPRVGNSVELFRVTTPSRHTLRRSPSSSPKDDRPARRGRGGRHTVGAADSALWLIEKRGGRFRGRRWRGAVVPVRERREGCQ